MTTSLILHIVKHPIGGDHIASILRSHPGSGFDDRLHRNAAYDEWEASHGLVEPMPAHILNAAKEADHPLEALDDAAEARVRSDDTLAAMTRASGFLRRHGDTGEAERTAILQLMALCPFEDLAESDKIPAEHAFWDICCDPVIVDHRRTRTVIDALTQAGADQERIDSTAACLAANLGRVMLILGH